MNLLRSSPLRFFSLASALQSPILDCCLVMAFSPDAAAIGAEAAGLAAAEAAGFALSAAKALPKTRAEPRTARDSSCFMVSPVLDAAPTRPQGDNGRAAAPDDPRS